MAIKILVCGLPGSGKTTLAKPLAELLDAVWMNADEVRSHYNDWDFSKEGRIRQAERMKFLADVVIEAGQSVVADFICPTEATRRDFDADYTVWMNTIDKGRFADTNQMFENPTSYNYIVTEWFDDTHTVLKDVIDKYMQQERNTI
tara:strand:+ start:444 stop:881 length:438 start_codon:yes stop_codon:yes gene_type:complete